MVKKTYLAILALFAVGLTGTVAFANVPDNVDLTVPPQERSQAYKPFVFESDTHIAMFMPLMTTSNDPSLNEINQSEGSALLHIFSNSAQWGCSGTLIAPNKILTAGHCVADRTGFVDAVGGFAYFENVQRPTSDFTFTGKFVYEIVDFTKHKNYNGKFWKAYDIAIVTIAVDADASIPKISIDENNNDQTGIDNDNSGQTVSVLGYGASGTGDTGKVLPFGTHRTGMNTIDSFGETIYEFLKWKKGDYKRNAVLLSDFDNGKFDQDGFGRFVNIPHLGLDDEVKVCSGDSGGSIRNANGEVTGINSFSLHVEDKDTGETSDIDNVRFNCTYGEFTGYTNVPYYADWIKSELGVETVESDGPNCNGKNVNNPKC